MLPQPPLGPPIAPLPATFERPPLPDRSASDPTYPEYKPSPSSIGAFERRQRYIADWRREALTKDLRPGTAPEGPDVANSPRGQRPTRTSVHNKETWGRAVGVGAADVLTTELGSRSDLLSLYEQPRGIHAVSPRAAPSSLAAAPLAPSPEDIPPGAPSLPTPCPPLLSHRSATFARSASRTSPTPFLSLPRSASFQSSSAALTPKSSSSHLSREEWIRDALDVPEELLDSPALRSSSARGAHRSGSPRSYIPNAPPGDGSGSGADHGAVRSLGSAQSGRSRTGRSAPSHPQRARGGRGIASAALVDMHRGAASSTLVSSSVARPHIEKLDPIGATLPAMSPEVPMSRQPSVSRSRNGRPLPARLITVASPPSGRQPGNQHSLPLPRESPGLPLPLLSPSKRQQSHRNRPRAPDTAPASPEIVFTPPSPPLSRHSHSRSPSRPVAEHRSNYTDETNPFEPDERLTFEVPSGARGRLRVSLAWLRDRGARRGEEGRGRVRTRRFEPVGPVSGSCRSGSITSLSASDEPPPVPPKHGRRHGRFPRSASGSDDGGASPERRRGRTVGSGLFARLKQAFRPGQRASPSVYAASSQSSSRPVYRAPSLQPDLHRRYDPTYLPLPARPQAQYRPFGYPFVPGPWGTWGSAPQRHQLGWPPRPALTATLSRPPPPPAAPSTARLSVDPPTEAPAHPPVSAYRPSPPMPASLVPLAPALPYWASYTYRAPRTYLPRRPRSPSPQPPPQPQPPPPPQTQRDRPGGQNVGRAWWQRPRPFGLFLRPQRPPRPAHVRARGTDDGGTLGRIKRWRRRVPFGRAPTVAVGAGAVGKGARPDGKQAARARDKRDKRGEHRSSVEQAVKTTREERKERRRRKRAERRDRREARREKRRVARDAGG